MEPSERSEEMLIALRRVIRAVDLHSRRLAQSHGLTGPQALLLKEVVREDGCSVGTLAQRVSLSQATVTDILNRLERRDLVVRERSDSDRRRVRVRATASGQQLVRSSPPLLQERFAQRFQELADWEQAMLLASVQRIAAMMGAEDLDAAPLLSSGTVNGLPELEGRDESESIEAS